MKYKATQKLIDSVREVGLAYIASLGTPAPEVPKHKNQELSNHIASNFGCQSNAVRELVVMLGWELPEPEVKFDEDYTAKFAVVRIVNTNMSINYKLGSLAVVIRQDGIALGTVKSYADDADKYQDGVYLGNHLFTECVKRVETVEELEEGLALLNEVDMHQYQPDDYRIEDLFEQLDKNVAPQSLPDEAIGDDQD